MLQQLIGSSKRVDVTATSFTAAPELKMRAEISKKQFCSPEAKSKMKAPDKLFTRIGNEFTSRTTDEVAHGHDMLSLALGALPEMGPKWDVHLPVFLTAPALARLLWFETVYRTAMDVPGQIVEFGSQWGASLNIFLLLKMIHEPWNAGRTINAFSTFGEGFVSVHEADRNIAKLNDYAVLPGWEEQLTHILETHAERSPVGARSNFNVLMGDATETFPRWLEENPGALISHAHFDMDVYEPTAKVLQLCVSRMPKGAVLIFDELNCPSFPGETQAVQDVLGIESLALRKSPFQPYSAYAIMGM